MKCNLLYITYYMHFTPNRDDIAPNDGTLLLTLHRLSKTPGTRFSAKLCLK